MKRVEVTGGIQHLLVARDVGISCISAAELAVAWMLLGAFPPVAHLWPESSQTSWEGVLLLCVGGCSVPQASLCWRTDLISFLWPGSSCLSNKLCCEKWPLGVCLCLCSCMCTHTQALTCAPANSSLTFHDADTCGAVFGIEFCIY